MTIDGFKGLLVIYRKLLNIVVFLDDNSIWLAYDDDDDDDDDLDDSALV